MTDNRGGTGYYGKYRGIVTNNNDPQRQGRIKAKVPNLLSNYESTWALPCVPYAGKGMGQYAVPPVGGMVWLEFEQGDLNYPVWVGCWWMGPDDVPPEAFAEIPPSTAPDNPDLNIVIKALNQFALAFTSKPEGAIILKNAKTDKEQSIISLKDNAITIQNGESSIVVASNGITLKNGSVSLSITSSVFKVENEASTIEVSATQVDIDDGALTVSK